MSERTRASFRRSNGASELGTGQSSAGIAHLLKGPLDGAIEEVKPVLDLAPELRVSTVTGYMDSLDARLRQSRLHGNRAARELRQRIRSFSLSALPAEAG
jgi:hypothetical protein